MSSPQLSQLFEEAVALSPEDRVPYLDRVCKGDAPLRAELERLLAADDRAKKEGFMRNPAFQWSSSTDTSSPIVFPAGEKIADRFRIIRFLGEGGMGQVYQAKDEVLNCFVALKTIRPEVASDHSTVERFKKEVKLAHEVADENVCRVFDLDHRNLPPFLTMEFIEGETLAARLRRAEGKRMTTAEALPLIEQMAQGLHAAHQKGVIHGDFKPGNVMLTETSGGRPRAKITDFGLARTTDGEGSVSSAHPAGTPPYMAPEQLAGGKATVASDIYALGLVMYEMVTGVKPDFNRMTEPALPPSKQVPGLDPKWDAVILRCLERDPAKRLESAMDVARSLHGDGLPGNRIIAAPSRRTLLKTGVSLAFMSLPGDILRVYRRKATVREGSTVLITDVENLTQDPELDGVTEVLRSQLGQSVHFNLMDRSRVSEILQQMVRDPSKKLDPPAAREVALREGAPLVVYGTLSRLAQDYTLNLKIEKVWNRPDSPAASWRQTWNSSNKSELFSAIHEGGIWIRTKAGEAAADVANADLKPEESTTPSWEALRLFSKAEKLKAKDKAEEAIIVLQEAVERDPQFALAWMRLGDLSRSIYRDREGLAHWKTALECLSVRPLPLREELRIRGLYAHETGDYLAQEKFFQRLSVHYPYDYLPLFYLADAMVRQGRVEEATEKLLAAQRLRPTAYYMPAHLARYYVMRGRLDLVSPYITRLRDLGQEDTSLFFEGVLHFLRGDYGNAEERFVQMSRLTQPQRSSRAYSALGCLYSELGRFRQALRSLEDGLSSDLRTGNTPQRAVKLLGIGYVRYRTGDRKGCRLACLQALDLEAGPDRIRKAGTLLARTGFTTDAQELLNKLTEFEGQPRAHRAALSISGELQLAAGRGNQAVETFQKLDALESYLTPREYLARALMICGNRKRAFELYKSIADYPERIWYQPDDEFPGLFGDSLASYSQLALIFGRLEATQAIRRYQQLRQSADSEVTLRNSTI